jgi:hypothetical protein
MKILDTVEFKPVTSSDEQSWWSASHKILGNNSPDVCGLEHQWHHTCVEWRIAEYKMDPDNIDAVLHLIMHEPVLSKRTEVNCWTPGYSPKDALAKRLEQIQVHIDKHTARMKPEHHRMAIHLPHKHPALDPIRQVGVRVDLLHPRILFMEGMRAKADGRRNYGVGKIREAHSLLAAEHQGKKGPWTSQRQEQQQSG